MSEIQQEAIFNNQPIPVPGEGAKTILYQLENCVCKIHQENDKQVSGFFCNIPYFDETLPFLITNNHVLNEKDIENKKNIELTINGAEKRIIEIDATRKRYTNKELDVTFVEIKPNKDNIHSFLELDEDINKENIILELEYTKKSIYMLHYPKGKLSLSYGLTENLVEGKKIKHIFNTEEGSLGSPILSLETYKIIGIHYGGNDNTNFGTFIKYAIEEFEKDTKQILNEINLIYEINEKIKKNCWKNNIFGKTFVENNRNNIELIINGEKSKLVETYKLKEGENKVKIIIKNKIKNLQEMFYECISLKNINELKYLDTNDVNNFECMFKGCKSLSDIKALEN